LPIFYIFFLIFSCHFFIYVFGFILIFFYKNDFMSGITMQLDILARLTPQVTTIICQYMKKVLFKKEKNKENTKIWGD